MSVTNEEVSGPNSIGGGGASTPTPATASSSASSGSTANSSGASPPSATDDVVKSGYLRKLKGKKKFYVLRKETDTDKPARLEYYANERKFLVGQPPKRSIVLKACFNISRTESKCKYSVALHTHNDCVRIAMNSEDEMNDWLRVMNSLAGDEEVEDDDVPTQTKPHFEHIWLVTALNKGLGSKENILGPYRLCLTSKELTLLKVGTHDHNNSVVKFPLNVIRNVSHDATFGCFFHIEFGRLAATGPGQLSLKTEDNNIAQNMHLLILKAMQNYSKEDLIPRENGQRRARTYTWNETSMSSTRSNSFHNTPPGLSRINSMDSCMRHRTESMSSSERRAAGMSPPMPIMSNPSIAFSSPLCSTGTDSASSSYSMELENNLNNNNSHSGSGLGHRGLLLPGLDYSKSCEEDESYVPYYPGDDQQSNSLRLPLHPDSSDYVDTSIGCKETGSAAQTPSSYMEVQSPMSPFDNYMPMSPAGGMLGGNGSVKSNGKLSVSHSRNSSLIEENDGYVPMIPGSIHSRSESGACSTAGSTTGLDEQYIEMDFARKLDLSNDEMQSSESIQSGTPSSEYNLDKVSSYLSDDMEGMRPARAYSVGSKSDTSSTGKGRNGKMRLEAVPESRLRSCSMGANSKPGRPILPSGRHCGLLQSVAIPCGKSGGPNAPLSSSWSGSGIRMQPYKYPPNYSHIQNQNTASTPSESADSDLMELDFSHNKKGRKRSLPGPGNMSSSSNSGSSNITKISPVPKGLLVMRGDTPPGGETPEAVSKPSMNHGIESSISSRYATSEPISIQKCNKSLDGSGMGYPDTGSSILTQMTGRDLKKLKELDDSGAYLDMDFSSNIYSSKMTKDKSYSTASIPRKSSQSNLPTSNSFLSNLLDSAMKSIAGNNGGSIGSNLSSHTNSPSVVVRAHDYNHVSGVKALNFLSSSTNAVSEQPPPLSRSLSSSSNISTTSNNSNSSSTSCVSVKSQHLHSHQCQPQTSQPPLMSPSVEPSHVIANSSQHSTTTSVVPPSLPSSLHLESCGGTTVTTLGTSVVTSSIATATSMGLSRIEESPEKQDPLRINHLNPTQSPPPSPSIISPDVDTQVTYATIQHPPTRRNLHFSGGTGCGSSAASNTIKPLTYAQIDFVKSPEVNVKNN